MGLTSTKDSQGIAGSRHQDHFSGVASRDEDRVFVEFVHCLDFSETWDLKDKKR